MQYAIVDIKTDKVLCFFSAEHKDLAYATVKNTNNTKVKKI